MIGGLSKIFVLWLESCVKIWELQTFKFVTCLFFFFFFISRVITANSISGWGSLNKLGILQANKYNAHFDATSVPVITATQKCDKSFFVVVLFGA